jgi:hypothetical protein
VTFEEEEEEEQEQDYTESIHERSPRTGWKTMASDASEGMKWAIQIKNHLNR